MAASGWVKGRDDSRIRAFPRNPTHFRQKQKLSEPMTFAEILAPVHAEFRARGLTEEKVTPVFEKLREEVWEERQDKKRAGK